jgi:hypothetical protein
MGEVDALLGRLPDSLANEIRLIHHEVTLKRIALLNYIDNVSGESLSHRIFVFFYSLIAYCLFLS